VSFSGESDRESAWLRRWHLGLGVGLLLVSAVLGATLTRRFFFLAAIVPLTLAPFSYARRRLDRSLRRALGAGARHARLLTALSAAGFALDAVMVVQLATARVSDALDDLHGPLVGWIGPVWFSAHAILFLGYAGLGGVRLVRRAARRLAASVRWPAAEEPRAPASPERRMFLQRAGLVGAGLPFFVSVSSVSLSYDFRVEEREIELPGWPRELDGLRVAHLSDIHVGGGMTRERLLRVAELTNASRPDLVAHTGDFLTHRSGDFDLPLYDALARIRAPYGQWGCLGNHDFDDAGRLVGRLADAGVVVLRDRTERLEVQGETLEVAGLDFVFGRSERSDVYQRLIGGFGDRAVGPRLLLNHDPSAFAALPDGAADLVLSGHTHGGHVGVQLGRDLALTVVGMLGLPDQGVFARDDMRLFVTRCVGFYGYPMRVGIPPEIALLVLRSPRSPARAV
jgi:predicted MPP superfamily phosphohydrolase